MGSNSFGFTLQQCAHAVMADPECISNRFDFNEGYNGQCKCAKANCTSYNNFDGYNVYQVVQAVACEDSNDPGWQSHCQSVAVHFAQGGDCDGAEASMCPKACGICQAPDTEVPDTEAPYTEAPNAEDDGPCGCEVNGVRFCNFDHGDTGVCEECADIDCYNDGLPQRGVNDCAARCTSAPYTEAPNTDSPYTEAPDTDSPYTEAPNTDSPYTEAPNTDSPYTEANPDQVTEPTVIEITGSINTEPNSITFNLEASTGEDAYEIDGAATQQ